MNKTIVAIEETTVNEKVREFAEALISNRYKMVEVSFVKGDGTNRVMRIIPNNSWLEMNGQTITPTGRKMIQTKIRRGVATVCEFLGEGQFQPRSINLNTITAFKVIA